MLFFILAPKNIDLKGENCLYAGVTGVYTPESQVKLYAGVTGQ